MKKLKRTILATLCVLTVFTACNDTRLLEAEQDASSIQVSLRAAEDFTDEITVRLPYSSFSSEAVAAFTENSDISSLLILTPSVSAPSSDVFTGFSATVRQIFSKELTIRLSGTPLKGDYTVSLLLSLPASYLKNGESYAATIRKWNVGKGEQVKTGYKLIYHANGGEESAVPVDSERYTSGSVAAVLSCPKDLKKKHHTFIAWNTSADGSGTTCRENSTVTFAEADVELYPLWKHNCISSPVSAQKGVRFQVSVPESGIHDIRLLRNDTDYSMVVNYQLNSSDEYEAGDTVYLIDPYVTAGKEYTYLLEFEFSDGTVLSSYAGTITPSYGEGEFSLAAFPSASYDTLSGRLTFEDVPQSASSEITSIVLSLASSADSYAYELTSLGEDRSLSLRKDSIGGTALDAWGKNLSFEALILSTDVRVDEVMDRREQFSFTMGNTWLKNNNASAVCFENLVIPEKTNTAAFDESRLAQIPDVSTLKNFSITDGTLVYEFSEDGKTVIEGEHTYLWCEENGVLSLKDDEEGDEASAETGAETSTDNPQSEASNLSQKEENTDEEVCGEFGKDLENCCCTGETRLVCLDGVYALGTMQAFTSGKKTLFTEWTLEGTTLSLNQDGTFELTVQDGGSAVKGTFENDEGIITLYAAASKGTEQTAEEKSEALRDFFVFTGEALYAFTKMEVTAAR